MNLIMVLTLNNTNTLTADNIILGGTIANICDKSRSRKQRPNINKYRRYSSAKHKQLQKINTIIDINTNLTNNYQTTRIKQK